MIHPKDVIERNLELVKAVNHGELVLCNHQAFAKQDLKRNEPFEYFSKEAALEISDDLCDEILSELDKLTLK